MNKFEQATTEKLDEMIGRQEPGSICQSGEVTYIKIDKPFNGVATGSVLEEEQC